MSTKSILLSFLFVLVAACSAMADLTFLQATSNATDGTSQTFASQNLGVAADDRCIIVAIGARGGSGGHAIHVTVAGIPAPIVQNTDEDTSVNFTLIAVAFVPVGTSGDIVITYHTTILRSRIAVYRATGCSMLPAFSGANDADDPTDDINVPAGGFAIAVACTLVSTATTSWTGLTENDDVNVEAAITVSVASDEFPTIQSGLTVTADFSSASDSSGVFAAWGPAVSGGGGVVDPLRQSIP